MLHNIQPGPMLFQTNPDMVYGIFAALVVSSLFQLFFGLVGVPLWIKVISAPKALMLAMIAVLSVVGSYGYSNNIVDVWIMLGFGVFGYVLNKIDFSINPIILALVLGGILEENFRRALMVSNGDYMIFVSHPISVGLLVVAAISLLSPLFLRRLAKPVV